MRPPTGALLAAVTPAARMAALSDGAIVGSAIVRMIGEYGEDAVEPVAAYVREMAASVHGV